MKTVLRNFIITLKRFRLASALNILGLSVAFAAFIVIMMQVRYDRGFDKFHSKVDRIYRLELSTDSTEFFPHVSRNMIELVLRSPQVETGSFFASGEYGPYLTVDRDDDKTGFKEYTMAVYPEFTDIFDFEMIEGDRKALEKSGRVLVPQSVAERFWGERPALDQPVTFMNEAPVTMTVGGVYKDFPDNTLLPNLIYVREDKDIKPSWDHWGNMGADMFLTLHSPDSETELEQTLLDQLNTIDHIKQWFPLKKVRLSLMPDIYYLSDMNGDNAPKGSRAATYVLLTIALLIIVIAVINFVNFSTSLAPARIKSINTQKVLGSPTSALRGTLVAEAVGISLFAFIASLLWIYLLGLTTFSQFLSFDIDLGNNIPIAGLAFMIAIIVGLLAGLYPAWYVTSFPPALVLKGSFGLSPQGKKLRTVLVGFQFVISIGLIIAVLFMQVQNNFMRGMETGLDTKRIAVVGLTADLAVNHGSTLANLLKENPQIQDVAFSSQVIGSQDSYSEWGFGQDEGGVRMSLQILGGSWNYPELMGAKLIDGRFFLENEDLSSTKKLLINDAAQKRYDLRIGQTFMNGTEIVGVIENFNFMSLRRSIEPMTFMLRDDFPPTILHVKIAGDPYKAIEHIRSSIVSIDPAYPADIQLYDAVFNKLYAQERKTTGLITIFSLLAVVISLVGMFGLVLFETQYRRKEIGVRKVFGATIGEILFMFNRRFGVTVIVCFAVSAPVAYIGVKSWLGNFAYRTPMHWWIFAIAFIAVAAITLLTVMIQSWRAATANPIDSLKNE